MQERNLCLLGILWLNFHTSRLHLFVNSFGLCMLIVNEEVVVVYNYFTFSTISQSKSVTETNLTQT